MERRRDLEKLLSKIIVKIAPIVIIDSREQTRWEFSNLPTERGTLDAGDYSLKNLTHLISIERKSLPDLLACVGRERARFRRELQRLKSYRFRTLIIEASHADLEAGQWRSQVKPSAVLGSLAAWQAQFSLPIWLAGTREAGAEFCERYLFRCARLIASENQALGVTELCEA